MISFTITYFWIHDSHLTINYFLTFYLEVGKKLVLASHVIFLSGGFRWAPCCSQPKRSCGSCGNCQLGIQVWYARIAICSHQGSILPWLDQGEYTGILPWLLTHISGLILIQSQKPCCSKKFKTRNITIGLVINKIKIWYFFSKRIKQSWNLCGNFHTPFQMVRVWIIL